MDKQFLPALNTVKNVNRNCTTPNLAMILLSDLKNLKPGKLKTESGTAKGNKVSETQMTSIPADTNKYLNSPIFIKSL